MFWTGLQQIWEVTLITHSSKADNFQGSGNPEPTPNHIYLKAVVAASSKNLKPSALTEHIWEASFHGLFNPSSLPSCEFVFGKPQNTQRSGFSLIKRPQKSRQSSKPSEPSECGKVKQENHTPAVSLNISHVCSFEQALKIPEALLSLLHWTWAQQRPHQKPSAKHLSSGTSPHAAA